MKERPILFSAPLVRALLDDTKTQTRRIVKLPGVTFDHVGYGPGTKWSFYESTGAYSGVERAHVPCPYGVPGDRLWVREAWRVFGGREYEYQQDRRQVIYRAGGPPPDVSMSLAREQAEACTGWRPSIHMPRWASRTTLEVTDVRVQRLRNISDEDAVAEGALRPDECRGGFGALAFARRFHAIYPEPDNPWVWAISFKRVAS